MLYKKEGTSKEGRLYAEAMGKKKNRQNIISSSIIVKAMQKEFTTKPDEKLFMSFTLIHLS